MNLANADRNNLDRIVSKEEKQYNNDIETLALDDDNISLSLIIRQIEDNSVVLDVGASTGYVGQYLNIKKKCSVYGIELSDKAIEIAKATNCYNDIFKIDLDFRDDNDSELLRYQNTECEFDYIVYGDILEHLKKPIDTMKVLSKKLKENGKIFVSIPNINNVDVIINLLDGKFNYSEYGLLDNTHIRFFTKKSFIDWIDNVNQSIDDYKLNIEKIQSTYYDSEYIKKLKSEKPHIARWLDGGEFYVFQNVFTITKNVLENKKDFQLDSDDYNLLKITINNFEKYQLEIDNLNSSNEDLHLINEDLQIQIKDLRSELEMIYNSKGWKLLKKIYKVKEKFLKK